MNMIWVYSFLDRVGYVKRETVKYQISREIPVSVFDHGLLRANIQLHESSAIVEKLFRGLVYELDHWLDFGINCVQKPGTSSMESVFHLLRCHFPNSSTVCGEVRGIQESTDRKRFFFDRVTFYKPFRQFINNKPNPDENPLGFPDDGIDQFVALRRQGFFHSGQVAYSISTDVFLSIVLNCKPRKVLEGLPKCVLRTARQTKPQAKIWIALDFPDPGLPWIQYAGLGSLPVSQSSNLTLPWKSQLLSKHATFVSKFIIRYFRNLFKATAATVTESPPSLL
ncbi:hypothetical protein BDY21DRAFT_367098 [Lineolata rhizophorae]|uniref:Uncharacterized protein n=1 Tax=Lineolata rhizophorae TaxID=578093 RepID=A0A6A6NP88_9PEZI|nr:hypothetical protein BDY21DRAFT_367098 [Lineolata rhizophorae]